LSRVKGQALRGDLPVRREIFLQHAKLVRKKLRSVHPKKIAAIKAEVEKLLKSGFIYPVPLIEWVSNIVPVAKKQGTIHVCIDYRDQNGEEHVIYYLSKSLSRPELRYSHVEKLVTPLSLIETSFFVFSSLTLVFQT
jgi:hypothetical protein